MPVIPMKPKPATSATVTITLPPETTALINKFVRAQSRQPEHSRPNVLAVLLEGVADAVKDIPR